MAHIALHFQVPAHFSELIFSHKPTELVLASVPLHAVFPLPETSYGCSFTFLIS